MLVSLLNESAHFAESSNLTACTSSDLIICLFSFLASVYGMSDRVSVVLISVVMLTEGFE